MSDIVELYEGNLWIQPDIAAPYDFLTCSGVGDVTVPRGARTIIYDQDLKHSGKLKPSGAITGTADFITTTLTRPLETVNNYLLELQCPFNARLNWVCRGSRTNPYNYELGYFLYDADFTSGTIAAPLSGSEATPNARIQTNGSLSAIAGTFVYPLAGAPLTPTSTTDVYSLAAVPSECSSKCGKKIGLGQIVWAGLESGTYSIGYLMVTHDYGATWLPPVAPGPFTVAGDVSDMEIVEIASGYRLICSCGTGTAGHAEVSYTDDEGDTFTNVYVGTVDTQTIQALCSDAAGNLWAAASEGWIYKSANQGATWTASLTGAPMTPDLQDIVFFNEYVGYAVGDTGSFWYTTNGGATWALLAGPAGATGLLSVDVNYAGFVFVTAAYQLFRSQDGGATWELMLDLGVGSIDQVRFDPDFRYFGYLVSTNSSPIGVVYRSEDGGNTWAQIGTPATDYPNAGIDCMAICDANMLYVGGAPQSGLSFVAKFERQK
jgi:hypothetical protein